MMIDFRTLLRAIWMLYGESEFTARDLSSALISAFGVLPEMRERFSVRRISGDLRRLYAIGFLRGRKQCHTLKSI